MVFSNANYLCRKVVSFWKLRHLARISKVLKLSAWSPYFLPPACAFVVFLFFFVPQSVILSSFLSKFSLTRPCHWSVVSKTRPSATPLSSHSAVLCHPTAQSSSCPVPPYCTAPWVIPTDLHYFLPWISQASADHSPAASLWDLDKIFSNPFSDVCT